MPVFLANKKNSSIRKSRRKSLVAQIILTLLGVELLFLSGFTAFNLPTATARNMQKYLFIKVCQLYMKFPRRWKRECEAVVPNLVAVLTAPIASVTAPTTSNTISSVNPAVPATSTIESTTSPVAPATLTIPMNPSSASPASTPTKGIAPSPIRYSLYVPHAPAAIFLGYVLGWPLAAIAAAIYLIAGLVGPFFKVYLFAAGSGLNYYLQPSFGYLIGIIVASACVGWFSRGERKSVNQLLSLFLGLLCIHGVGLAYLIGICLFGAMHEVTGEQLTWSAWVFEEARNLSWYALPYDLIFSFALIGIGFPFRWLVAILTAPDMLVSGLSDEEKLIDFQLAKR